MSTPTILISGASRGLGAAAARVAAQMGANVALMARSADDLSTVAQDVRDAGGQALAIVGDVSWATDCQRSVAETIKAFGQLDALVNNAGMLHPIGPIIDADPEEWQRNLAVNLLGPFHLTQVALPHLRRTSGRVINVSSGAAMKAVPGWAAYCAAKAALNHFTRILAEEESGITAIAFRPGAMDTTMQATIRLEGATGMPEDLYTYYVRRYEEGQLLPPEVPGCALTVLAFHAPHEWSGSFLPWNQEDVQSLVRRFACAAGTPNR
jgi:NAD(P)-dependent dehydrogenase (short-subunit alcohol dehydrogenase family)